MEQAGVYMHEKTMKLYEFIRKMKEGWGHEYPLQVIRIGHALARDIRDSGARNISCRVLYSASSVVVGDIPYTCYTWSVSGIFLLRTGTLPPLCRNLFFSGVLPEAENTDYGFVVRLYEREELR